MSDFHLIGDPFDEESRPSVFQLIIDDHIKFVNPKSFGIREQSINPRDYFITSGDAIQKTKVLEKELWKLASRLRQRVIDQMMTESKISITKARDRYKKGKGPKRPKKLRDYEKAVWAAAGQARSLINKLKKARGDACFFETEWDDHRLLCIPKNPRR
jgi:hypothetical protein